MRKIELLAPAKSYEAARAAIDHGADAIYMGGARFGARVAACNTTEDLARAAEYAHQFGAKIYATLNTLIFEEELKDAERAAREMIDAGVDALIVQDLAFARMDLGVELHASTQMCNTSVEGVRFLSQLGFARVVMERNLSLEKLREIATAVEGVEMEIFVHGAICVGQSGRCLLSRSMNPLRSGNRGSCSQPCRVSYDLIDGAGGVVLEGKHLLSVRDLNLSRQIGQLLDMGATSFKIEGRLKDLSYTKNIVSHYRAVIDRELSQREGLVRSSQGESRIEFEANPAKSFSRGETIYMFEGQRRGVASFETPKSMGEEIAEVSAVDGRGESLTLSLNRGVTLSNGDGLCYIGRGGLQGCNINRIEDRNRVWLSKRVELRVGTKIYRNYDRKFESMVDSSRTRRTIPISGALSSCETGVEVIYWDRDQTRAKVLLEGSFERAQNHEKMERTIESQLSKCGDTIFETTHIDLSGWSGEFIASSQLASLRREALERLKELREGRVEQQRLSEQRVFVECMETKYPNAIVGAEMGVTNSLARALYLDHGARSVEPSYELRDSFEGVEVLRSSYCIRNEMGECLRRGSGVRGELFLVRGEARYRLNFDCKRCEMTLIKV